MISKQRFLGGRRRRTERHLRTVTLVVTRGDRWRRGETKRVVQRTGVTALRIAMGPQRGGRRRHGGHTGRLGPSRGPITQETHSVIGALRTVEARRVYSAFAQSLPIYSLPPHAGAFE